MLICARVLSRAQLTEDDFNWLPTFADRAAVAIANARRFKKIDRLRAKLELGNEYLQTRVEACHDQI
jgi:GAF domain-containing protein